MARPSAMLRWRVQAEEHYRAIRALGREHAHQQRRIWRELRIVALAAFTLVAAALVGRRWHEIHQPPWGLLWIFGVPLLLVGAWAATRPIALKRGVKRQLADDPSTQQERRYTLDHTGLHIDGEAFHVELLWPKIIVVRETNEFFLFISRKAAYYLPKRAVAWPERLETVRELLVEYLGDRADVR